MVDDAPPRPSLSTTADLPPCWLPVVAATCVLLLVGPGEDVAAVGNKVNPDAETNTIDIGVREHKYRSKLLALTVTFELVRTIRTAYGSVPSAVLESRTLSKTTF